MTCANHPDRPNKAFCQNCGKPLCAECARTVGQAVFCEPCLEARLNATAGPLGSQPFGAAPPSGYGAASGGAAPPFAAQPGVPYSPATPPPGSPNPGIAFLLGLIPGVGAMYNGQYAKGVVHLIIFAVFVSLSDQNGLFGLFVTLWVFYQAFEAFHTARARRDGTPLPNPFGLNDVGERFGFGRSWPAPPPVGSPFGGPVGGPVGSSAGSPAPAPFRSDAEAGAPPTAAYPPSPETPFGAAAPPFSGFGAEASPWGAPTESYAGYASSPIAAPLPSASRFPVGAVVLIGLGVLFLLGSTRMFEGFPVHFLLPFLLIGVGVWIFVRRMTATGISLLDDGSLAYRLRLIRALQSSVWVVLVGVLFLLDTLHVLSWGRSWPLFIIVGGIMAFVQRSAYTSAARPDLYPNYPPAPPPQPPPTATPPAAETSIAPRDREGA